MLRINPKKTKVMIFQKLRAKKCTESSFPDIDNEIIEIVQNYTYLNNNNNSNNNNTNNNNNNLYSID